MECGTFANRGDVLDILCGASQASRAADEVIEYGTRTSDIVHKAEVPSRPTHVSY